MNITILYGRDLKEDSIDVQVATQAYDADEVIYIEEINAANLNAIREETGCKTSEVLVITNDDLSDLRHLRNLYSDCEQLNLVQSVKNLRKAYSDIYPLDSSQK